MAMKRTLPKKKVPKKTPARTGKPQGRARPAKPARPENSTRPARPITKHHSRIHVLSDSTGNLARHMLAAFLTQFPGDAFDVHYYNYIQDRSKLDTALAAIRREPGIVLHALVRPEAKALVAERCREAGLPEADLTGQFISFISTHTGITPQHDVQQLHRVNEAYHARIRAIEFAMQHDDGLGLETLGQADIVLVGVSRTSKTPTSIYLAQQGYKVGNYALAAEVGPPPQVLALPPQKVVGLVINPLQLAEIRARRRAAWRMTDTHYSDPALVSREIAWSKRLFIRQGWPVLDVTDQAIEETAARVLALLGYTAS